MKSEQWHADRRTGLGGSDAPAALGVSKWKTPLQLFLEKIGQAETLESEPMYWGTTFEPHVRQRYCDVTGRTVVVPAEILRHAKWSFMIGNVDGIADDSRLLEVKTARTSDGWGEPGTDEIPDEYAIQVQHYLCVTGLEVADVAVLFGGQKFALYEVPGDVELQEMIVSGEAEFWKRVCNQDPPEPTTLADVKLRYPISKLDAGLASAATASLCERLAYLKSQIGQAEDLAEEWQAAIAGEIGERQGLVGPDGKPLVTWKSAAAPRNLDIDALKKDHPEIYAAYLRDGKPQRRFLLKVKGESCPQTLPNLETVEALLSLPPEAQVLAQ